ncbi:esterase/lipase family protein, partial [Streptococcus suis]
MVLVHGFLGLVGENAPALYPNYWGGNKFKVIEALRKKGYDIHQASVGAFSSNYARAVDLYYFIKGGRVDYGAAHAAQYGHERFGKIYKGIMPDWRPGKKVHLIGHSMGGQTVRLMEELLRNGSKDEIAYHQKHGGTISPLFKGGLTDMVSSITTLGT